MNSTVNRAKGSIRFSFKDSIKNLQEQPKKQSLIMLHFSYGKIRMKYSTGFYSCYSDWDFSKQQLRNKVHLLDRDNVNNFLSGLKNGLSREVSRLNAENISVSKKLIRDKLNQKTKSASKTDKITFYDYTELFCNRKKGRIANGTLKSYKQTVRLLKEFSSNLNFDDIDLTFYYDFVRFLEEDNKSLNTIGKHIKNLKSFLKSATEAGHNKNLAYKYKEFKAPKELTTAIYLTENEIQAIKDLNLRKHPHYDKARDIFIIGCETGQRVSDYNGLTKNNICTLNNMEFFKIIQRKTEKTVHCPITKDVRKIMKKYHGCPPPKMPAQKINQYLKIIARIARVNDEIECKFTKRGEKVTKNRPKYQMVCTHTARRSFCTNMYKKEMPTFEIMVFSGHSTEKEFYKYIRIEKEQQAVKIAQSGFFDL